MTRIFVSLRHLHYACHVESPRSSLRMFQLWIALHHASKFSNCQGSPDSVVKSVGPLQEHIFPLCLFGHVFFFLSLSLTFTGIVYCSAMTLSIAAKDYQGQIAFIVKCNRCCYVQRNLFAHTLWNGSSIILSRGEENVRKYRHKSFHRS